MSRKIEERQERQERPGPKDPLLSGGKKRKPRGALFHGNDPTLAKRAEEELHSFGR